MKAVTKMQDEVSMRVSDFNGESRVFEADIYYLKLCLESNLRKFDCPETIKDRISETIVVFRGDRFHNRISGLGFWFVLAENSKFKSLGNTII